MKQEAKEKEKKQKAANAAEEGGVSFDELTLKVQSLQAEKKLEEEARNHMQLERVRSGPPQSGFDPVFLH